MTRESPELSERRVIVGTAGHVDHGKTRLIEALTGIDCDRWAEEKSRGITIDLGFAHLVEGDLQIGFIDVPGHEKFLHNALAGLGGIRVLLLVVAADEGVAPQTREHLAIASLLEIPHAVIALTKSDLVNEDLLELAVLELDELLAPTPFAEAPIVPLSAVSGEGVDDLRTTLLDVARRAAIDGEDEGPARLPIDRAFQLKGLGSVVTGTLLSGSLAVGDELELVPGRSRGRVRTLQVHGTPRERVSSGQRVSVQVAGWDLEALDRGDQLADPGTLEESHSLLVHCSMLPDAGLEISGWTPVRLHLHSSETLGKARPVDTESLPPGEEGLIEIRLDRAVAAVRGDRYILRRPSPARTLGGGRIHDPRWHRRPARSRRTAAAAIARGTLEALMAWISEAGEGGIDAGTLARRLGSPEAAVERRLRKLGSEGRLLSVKGKGNAPRRWIGPDVVRRVEKRAHRVLGDYFDQNRLSDTLSKAEAVRRILRPSGRPLADTYLRWLADRDVLVVAGDRVGLQGRTTLLTDEESALATAILQAFEAGGLTPTSPAEISRAQNAKPQIFEGMVSYLIDQEKLVRLPGGLVLSATALDAARRDLVATGWDRFEVPRFKERFGLSRKWAIPILEHFDSQGVTRRVGDERQIVG